MNCLRLTLPAARGWQPTLLLVFLKFMPLNAQWAILFEYVQRNYQKTVTITKPHEEFMMNNELNPSTDQFAKPLCMPLLNLKVC